MRLQASNFQSQNTLSCNTTHAPSNDLSTKLTGAKAQSATQTIPIRNAKDTVPPQVDGPGDRSVGTYSNHFSASCASQNLHTSANVATFNTGDNQLPTVDVDKALGLLPWCTSDGRLRDDQAIALSDVGGSLKEIMLVALAAVVDEGARDGIERAVGSAAAATVIEFWNEEYAVD